MNDYNRETFIKSKFKLVSKNMNGYIADCTSCGKPKKLYVSNSDAYPFNCKSCGFSGNIFTLGFKDNIKKEFTEFDKKVWSYHKKSNKKHRLSERVIKEFKLNLGTFISKVKKEFQAIVLRDFTGEPVKRLIVDRWLGISGKSKYWYYENINKNMDTIYFVSGEWDLFSFWEHTGIRAIASLTGETARGDWRLTDIFELLQDKKVVIVFDTDTAGIDGAKSLAKDIYRRTNVKEIKIIDLLIKKDIDDYFNIYHNTKKAFLDIVLKTNIYKKDIKLMDDLDVKQCHDYPLEYKNSIFDDDLLRLIWSIGLENTNYVRQKYKSIAMEKSKIHNKEDINALIKSYEVEFFSMFVVYYEAIIDKYIVTHNIKKRKKNISGEVLEDSIFYRYKNGCYYFIDKSEIIQIIDDLIYYKIKYHAPSKQQSYQKSIKILFFSKLEKLKEVEFDTTSYILNFTNGFYFCKTRKFEEHKDHMNLYFTHQFNFDYNLNKDYKPFNFSSALDTWFRHSPHMKREFLKTLFYLISGDRSEQIFLHFFGDTKGVQGNNAKSEATKLFSHIIGEKFTSRLTLKMLENDFHIGRLLNKRLNITDEVGIGKSLRDIMEGTFKSIVGGETIWGDRKFGSEVSIKSQVLWIIASNQALPTRDSSYGMKRRKKMITFSTIRKEEIIKNFFELKLKEEIPDIVNYVIDDGYNAYVEDKGFCTSEEEEKIDVELNINTTIGFWNMIKSEILNKQIVDQDKKIYLHEYICDLDENFDLKYYLLCQFYFYRFEQQPITGKKYIALPSFFESYKKYCVDNGNRGAGLVSFNKDAKNFFLNTFKDLIELRNHDVRLPDKSVKNVLVVDIPEKTLIIISKIFEVLARLEMGKQTKSFDDVDNIF